MIHFSPDSLEFPLPPRSDDAVRLRPGLPAPAADRDPRGEPGQAADRQPGDLGREPAVAAGQPATTPSSEALRANAPLAARLEEVAELLASHGANPFRVRAYRRGAVALRSLPVAAAAILADAGIDGLIEIPAIGKSLAQAIKQLVQTGHLGLLDRLRGDDAEAIFATVPELGETLARRIHQTLAIETLAELAEAARDGRLKRVPGMGPKRIRAVRESLAGRFAQLAARPSAGPPSTDSAPASQAARPQLAAAEPSVAELLDIDAEYRRRGQLGQLPRIAPRRNNPEQRRWLPVLHTTRGHRHYTALYSNTLHAHQQGTTGDWVVIYCDDWEHPGRWTVITAQFGPLAGRRIVAGHDTQCLAHYAAASRLAPGTPEGDQP